MRDLERRIAELQRQIQNATAEELPTLERDVRELLTDTKNTPYEDAARALYTALAQRSRPPAPAYESDAVVRGMLRRARIRMEMAGGDEDIDDAIDILTDALTTAPHDPNVIALLQEASQHSPQAVHRVRDLFNRYGVDAPINDPLPPQSTYTSPPTNPTRPNAYAEDVPPVPSSAPLGNEPIYTPQSNDTPDALMSKLNESYYAGDYQQTVDIANRILAQDPNNTTARDYREKSEDNIVRGIVPDHRIPFEARVAYNRANSLVRAGNYDEAARLYREARELAEKSGILSWKDVEQALLDIQDLALARELLNEGDRFIATDNWTEALRKYEGALRVVPNDPQAEERIENVRRIQQDADQVTLDLNMLGGSLSEQVKQLLKIRSTLARARQLLPASQRLAQLGSQVEGKLNSIKTQLNDQAQAALERVQNASTLQDRLALTNNALQLMDLAIELDPADTSTSALLMDARARANDMNRARQVIERAGAMVAQNFDTELNQARSMLAGLSDYAQDDRYRAVVNDLMTRYMERAEMALEEGDTRVAQGWLDAMREDPFRILGRRTEIYRIETGLRRQRGRTRMIAGGAGLIVLFLCGVTLLFTQGIWQPALFPTATPTETPTETPTMTFTPSITPTPSETFTPSPTPTATETSTITATPTWTWTPSPTWTPSFTPTATLTPTHTHTPTPTDTPTETPTETASPTVTLTPSITPTPPGLCQLVVTGTQGIFMREDPTTTSPRVAVLQPLTVVEALEVSPQIGLADPPLWYRVRVQSADGQLVDGWVRANLLTEITPCPDLPSN